MSLIPSYQVEVTLGVTLFDDVLKPPYFTEFLKLLTGSIPVNSLIKKSLKSLL